MKIFLLVWMFTFSDGIKRYGSETFTSSEDAAVFIYRQDETKYTYKLYTVELPDKGVQEVAIPTIVFKR